MNASGTGPRSRGVQTAVSVAAFVLLGILGGVLWHLMVDLPDYTRVGESGSMDAVELSKSVAIDGWYAAVAVVLAALAGAVLTVWTRHSPRYNVLMLSVGGALAGLLMLATGHQFGPGDVEGRLAAAPEGARVTVELVPSSDAVNLLGLSTHAIFLLWPIAALAGAAMVLLFGPSSHEEDPAG